VRRSFRSLFERIRTQQQYTLFADFQRLARRELPVDAPAEEVKISEPAELPQLLAVIQCVRQWRQAGLWDDEVAIKAISDAEMDVSYDGSTWNDESTWNNESDS
jgi:hypothetical protein